MVQASEHEAAVAEAVSGFGEKFVKPGESVIALSGITFTATCAHDGDPFTGEVNIAYEPDQFICGLGGFSRAVAKLSSIPQLQEIMAQDLCDAINGALSPKGVLVQITAHHRCLSSRFKNAETANFSTVSYSGSLAGDTARLSAMLLISGGA